MREAASRYRRKFSGTFGRRTGRSSRWAAPGPHRGPATPARCHRSLSFSSVAWSSLSHCALISSEPRCALSEPLVILRLVGACLSDWTSRQRQVLPDGGPGGEGPWTGCLHTSPVCILGQAASAPGPWQGMISIASLNPSQHRVRNKSGWKAYFRELPWDFHPTRPCSPTLLPSQPPLPQGCWMALAGSFALWLLVLFGQWGTLAGEGRGSRRSGQKFLSPACFLQYRSHMGSPNG